MIEIKKLVRQDYNGKWWYTLRWMQEYKDSYGNYWTKDVCVDSPVFEKYRMCHKAAKEHIKRLEGLNAPTD